MAAEKSITNKWSGLKSPSNIHVSNTGVKREAESAPSQVDIESGVIVAGSQLL